MPENNHPLPSKNPKALFEALIFFAVTLGAAFLIFWGPLALFQIPAISFVSSERGPLWAILLYMTGAFGPSAAALILTWRWEGKEGLRRMGKRLIQFKIGWRWYLAAVAVVLLGTLGQIVVIRLMDKPFDTSLFLAQLGSFLPLLILGPLSEELGWRGFALDRLQVRFNPIVASLLVGTAWAFWHLPLFLMPATSQHELSIPFIPFLITLAAQSVIYTWLHNHTGGSIWTAVFFHWIYTYAAQVVFTGVAQYTVFHWYGMIPYLLAALVILVLWRPGNKPARSGVVDYKLLGEQR